MPYITLFQRRIDAKGIGDRFAARSADVASAEVQLFERLVGFEALTNRDRALWAQFVPKEVERGHDRTDRDILGQCLDNLWVESLVALVGEVPRLNLVVLIVAQGRKNDAPALGAEAVATQAANEGAIGASGGYDSLMSVQGSAPQRRQR